MGGQKCSVCMWLGSRMSVRLRVRGVRLKRCGLEEIRLLQCSREQGISVNM